MDASGLSKAKTKDEFLSKAHEARQARELARRQDNAATTLQSHIRRFITWRRLKRDVHQEQARLQDSLESGDHARSLSTLRRVLFFYQPDKDREMIESTLRFIYNATGDKQMRSGPEVGKANTSPSTENVDIELVGENITVPDKSPDTTTRPSFTSLLLEAASKDEETFKSCIRVVSRLIEICTSLIDENISKQSDLQSMVTYIGIINVSTNRETNMRSPPQDNDAAKGSADFFNELSNATIHKRRKVFLSLSNSTAKMIKGPRTDAKAGLLIGYMQLSLKLIDSPQASSSTPALHIDQINFLIKLFSVPALVYYIEQYSPECIPRIRDNSTLKQCLNLMSTSDQQLQSLTSTPALCLVANLIHLSSLTEETLVTDKIPFVTTVTKLLEHCQKNMKQIYSLQTGTAKKGAKKPNDSTGESYNHILGWLTRETAHTIDQETSRLIKSQLSHLWSVKFLRLLLTDLTKANENQRLKKAANNTSSDQNSKTAQAPKHKSFVGAPPRGSSGHDHQLTCDNTTSTHNVPISSFKRAVERAAYSMTRSLGYSYNKTTSSSGTHSNGAKLMTEEARRISLVCFMLHTALKTLRIIKQDILTGLCFHDYILSNLWDYISSLSSQNGLKAFLDHLIVHSKSSMPEFHILMLFCECSSHIISILDDSELYEQQRPFTLDDLVNISAFLNVFVFRVISNQLVSFKAQEMDPILQSTHKLLTDLYKRDCKRKFAPQDHWLIKDVKMSLFLKDLDAGKPVAQAIITLLPHIIPHKERVLIFRKLVAKDRSGYSTCYSTFITIHRSRIVEDGYQQLARLPSTALKGLIRVKFINDHGLDEAGIDQDGVFKEFLEDTIKRVFDPGLNLFSTTSEQRLYPSPTSRLHEDHLSLFNFVGKMLGKAVYEGIVVDVPFATFFLSRVLGQHHYALYSPIDDLASLDPELYKNLIYIRHHDVSDLDLTFSIDQDMMGKIETYELEPGGKFIPVTNESRVRYIHSVANFRMKTQIEEQTEAFVRGFKSIINLDWLHMFSASEFQRLISGDTAPIDLQDLRRNTKYFGGFHNNHRVVCWLWDILESDLTPEEHRLFLKFVTSCSKPPLLGFANLEPPFSIRCVEVGDDQDLGDTVGSVLRGFFAIRRSDPVDRLPTSSTCFNLLKLPNYQRRSTLREKLRYAISSSTGFELS